MMDDVIRREWEAWQEVMRALADLGLSNEMINEEGSHLVHMLKRWADKRAELIREKGHEAR